MTFISVLTRPVLTALTLAETPGEVSYMLTRAKVASDLNFPPRQKIFLFLFIHGILV